MRTGRICSLVVWLSPCLLAALSPRLADCRADFDELIDSPMYQAPDLPAARVEYVLPEKTKALWMKALGRPEEDLNCKAADAVAEAHRQGVKGWTARNSVRPCASRRRAPWRPWTRARRPRVSWSARGRATATCARWSNLP
jgi:hypothetical protein